MNQPLRIVALTQVQFDTFLHSQGIPRHHADRIFPSEKMRGLNKEARVLLLPRWFECDRGINDVVHEFKVRGGVPEEISEAQVLGKDQWNINARPAAASPQPES